MAAVWVAPSRPVLLSLLPSAFALASIRAGEAVAIGRASKSMEFCGGGYSFPSARSYHSCSGGPGRVWNGERQRGSERVLFGCVAQTMRSFSVERQSAVESVAAGDSRSNSLRRRLILYSKPGCCLCDGLKEKLLDGAEALGDIQLEIRDITTNTEWWNAYQYEIPVLARFRFDGTEEPLPRFSPRLTSEQIHKKIQGIMTPVF